MVLGTQEFLAGRVVMQFELTRKSQSHEKRGQVIHFVAEGAKGRGGWQ